MDTARHSEPKWLKYAENMQKKIFDHITAYGVKKNIENIEVIMQYISLLFHF